MNKVLEIDVKSLREALESKEICLIDVRERIENAEEKIEGSVLLSLKC